MSNPDFNDPAIQSSSPQREILQWLLDLSDTWQVIETRTHADETALGVLYLAKGAELHGAPPGPIKARLTISGVRWKGVLHANTGTKENVARAAVLKFVWDSYLKHEKAKSGKGAAADPSLIPFESQAMSIRNSSDEDQPRAVAPKANASWSAGTFLAKAQELSKRLRVWHITDFLSPIKTVSEVESREWVRLTFADILGSDDRTDRPLQSIQVYCNEDGKPDENGYVGRAFQNPERDTDHSLTQFLLADFRRNLHAAESSPALDYLRESFLGLLRLPAWTIRRPGKDDLLTDVEFFIAGRPVPTELLESLVDAGRKLLEEDLHLARSKLNRHGEAQEGMPDANKSMNPAANRHLVFRSLKQKFEAAAQRFPEFQFFVFKLDDKEQLVTPYWIDRKSQLEEKRFHAGTVDASGFWATAGDERELWYVGGPEDALREYERLASEAGSALPRTEDFPLRNILAFRIDPYIIVSMKERWTLFVFDTLKRSGGSHIVLAEQEDQRRQRFGQGNEDKPEYATYAFTSSDIFASSARAIEYAGLEEPTKGRAIANDAALTITLGSAVDHPPLRCKTLNEVKKWLEEWFAKFRDYPNIIPNYFLETEYAGGIIDKRENPRMVMARVTVANFACNQVERWLRDNGHSTALSEPTGDKDLMAAERRLSNCLDYVRKMNAESENSTLPNDDPVKRSGISAALANDKECPGCKSPVAEAAQFAPKFICRTCREWELQTGVLVLPVMGPPGTPPEIVRVHAPCWKPYSDSQGIHSDRNELPKTADGGPNSKQLDPCTYGITLLIEAKRNSERPTIDSLAKAIGVKRQALYDNKEFEAFRTTANQLFGLFGEKPKRGDRRGPRGNKSKDGTLEAEDPESD